MAYNPKLDEYKVKLKAAGTLYSTFSDWGAAALDRPPDLMLHEGSKRIPLYMAIDDDDYKRCVESAKTLRDYFDDVRIERA